jgi:general secretion pathway protein N
MSARRLGLYLGLGALAYAVALAATLPAAWVSHAVGRATQERMVLRDEAGSAWSGSGRLYARQRSGQLVDLGALRWRAQPASLLGGKLHAELTFGDTGKVTSLDLSPASVTVQGLDIEFPGVVLAAIEPALEALAPEGVVRLRAEKLRIDADSMLGLADIEWRGIRLARAHDLDLGSHVARLRGGGSKVDIELGTLSGPLELRGGGTWVRRSGFNISGSAEPRSAELAAFLRSVCAEYRDSRCTFRYSRGL